MTTGKHVALLRGINVGRAKRVAMADLRTMMEGLGYRDVRTLLNSGNVVFTATGRTTSANASRIEKSITAQLGISSRVIVLSAAELASIVESNPLLQIADDPSRLFVAVLKDSADRARLEPLLNEDWAPDVLGLGERAAYMWCSEGSVASRLAESVGRVLRDATTTRNWATILKLHALTSDQK